MMIQKIIQELQDIPEEKLAELFFVIHYFRLGLSKDASQPRTPGLLAGKLGDAFFEPLPEDEAADIMLKALQTSQVQDKE